MINLMNAEVQKLKRTFALKLVWIAPLVMILFCYATGKDQGNTCSWWFSMLFPGILAIICSAVIQKDARTKYHNIFNLPVSKGMMWIGKIEACIVLALLSCVIFVAGIAAVSNKISLYQCISGCIVLFITVMWQIPFCMLISARFGTVFSILANLALSVYGLAAFSNSSMWFAFPYAISQRLLYPLLHYLPGGFSKGSSLLSGSVIAPGIAISLIWLVFILIISTIWFGKQEAK